MNGERGPLKKTRLSSVASLLATGMLMGGCMAEVGGQSESKGGAAQEPNVGGGEAVGEAKQALQAPIAGMWTDWQPLTGTTLKSPAISSRGNGTFDVFALSVDNNIYMKSYANGEFGPWANLGGAPGGHTFVSDPDAVSSDANSFAVVAMANNGKYYLNTWTATSGMSGWNELQGTFSTHGPGISSRGPGILDVFGSGTDNQAWQVWLDGGAWTCCAPHGSPQNAPLASNMTSVSWASNHVKLFVRGLDNSLWTRWWFAATGWLPSQGWASLGGQFSSGMGAASWAPGHLDVFGVGTDSQIWQTQYDAGWSAFTPVGAPPGLTVASSPDAVSSGSGRIHLVVRGSDNQPWVRSFTAFNVGSIRRTAQVSGSYHQGVAVKSDGTVWAVGTDRGGQLTLEQVMELTDVVAVNSGEYHHLAVKRDGTVWTWGWGSRATRVEGLTDVVAVEAGHDYSLALKSDGTLWAWGGNSQGQLGTGTTSPAIRTPTQVLTDVVSVSGGEFHTLAVKSDGTVWAWGSNHYGKLGYATGGYASPTPRQVPNLTGVVQVSAGWQHSAALKRDGTVWTWGWNRDGQLGDATPHYRETPTPINGLSGVVTIDAGYYATYQLALKADGTLWNWNSRGPRMPLSGVVAMSAGYSHSLAVKSDGTLWTWTMTDNTPELVPVPVKL